MAKIEIKGLYKIFGDHPEKAIKLLEQGVSKQEILKKTKQAVGVIDATLSIEEGEVFVIMGLSGSGKSTLLRCVNRLIEPTKGEIIIDGQDVAKASNEQLMEIRRKKLGMVFQRFALFPHKNILDNVAYGLEIQGMNKEERREKAMEALKLVGLSGWEYNLPKQLSGGMQQRVGLARALASDPDILLMDEAFSALDPLIRKEMQDELLSLQGKMNKTILFVSHDLDEALKIGDRIALMKDGEVVQVGNPEEILRNPANEYVEKFVEDVDISKVLTAENVMKSPQPLISLKDGPRVALRRMKETGISSIFVVSKDRKLKGIVMAEDAVKAIQEENHQGIEEIMKTDIIKVLPDKPINDLIPILAEAKVPVAVVDEEEKLLGIIVRGLLLAGLVKKGGVDGVA